MVETLRNFLYILQLEEYDIGRFQEWLKKHRTWGSSEKKKRLAWTFKAKLLFAIAFFYNILSLFRNPAKTLIFASYTIFPLEYLTKKVLVSIAKFKISRMKTIIVIGIAGSFGKTSTKIILKQILSKNYKVLATPLSYNTPLGIAKTILKNIKPKHEIFIVEMGAYKKGDIKGLCEIVKPRIGILTGINEQHLERFGNLKNTIATKYELIQALPKSGLAVFNYDNRYTHQLAQKTKIHKICYSLNFEADAEIKATNIETSTLGTKFLLPPGNKIPREYEIKTPLIGRSQVLNTLAAIAVATHFKIPLNVQRSMLSILSPIPHRLQLIDPGRGILIIDDTFSANPDGFHEALEVLKSFEGRRKIIVTPGIIELGKKEQKIHLNLGEKIGKICDFIILVGENCRSDALRKGISGTDFPRENLTTVRDLKEAQSLLEEISRPMDIILFENDLPDQYT